MADHEGHGRWVCGKCGTLIRQCKCPSSGDLVITDELCPKCRPPTGYQKYRGYIGIPKFQARVIREDGNPDFTYGDSDCPVHGKPAEAEHPTAECTCESLLGLRNCPACKAKRGESNGSDVEAEDISDSSSPFKKSRPREES